VIELGGTPNALAFHHSRFQVAARLLLCRRLRDRGVSTDGRGRHLHLGAAPYRSDAQLESAIGTLGAAITDLQ